jgi:hypothetical protein
MTDAIIPGDRRVGDPGTITFDEHVVDNPATHRVQLLNASTRETFWIDIVVGPDVDPLDAASAAAETYIPSEPGWDLDTYYLVAGAPELLA